jgi:hypothetical protein
VPRPPWQKRPAVVIPLAALLLVTALAALALLLGAS